MGVRQNKPNDKPMHFHESLCQSFGLDSSEGQTILKTSVFENREREREREREKREEKSEERKGAGGERERERERERETERQRDREKETEREMKVVLLLLAVLLCVVSSARGFSLTQHVDFFRRKLEKNAGGEERMKREQRRESGATTIPSALWFDKQQVDHFDPSNDETWSQRYFLNQTFYDATNPLVFLCVGGEGPAFQVRPTNENSGGGRSLTRGIMSFSPLLPSTFLLPFFFSPKKKKGIGFRARSLYSPQFPVCCRYDIIAYRGGYRWSALCLDDSLG